MKVILEVKGLLKTYENMQDPILKNINLQMKEKEFVAIMGPSGSGKSTLLYNISGMDKMTAGSVIFDGEEIGTLSEEDLTKLRLYKMGFIFQQMHLLKNLTIFDNIILSAYVAKKSSRQKINQRATELMRKTGIVSLANNEITEASGGELQRAAICRALINHPKILFGDEPTGALNTKSAAEIMELLGNINEEGTAILLVTHDTKVAAKAERVLYMIDGEIVGEQTLGKFNVANHDIKEREEILSTWLHKMDF